MSNIDALLGNVETAVKSFITEKEVSREDARDFRDSLTTLLDEIGDLYQEIAEYEKDEDEE